MRSEATAPPWQDENRLNPARLGRYAGRIHVLYCAAGSEPFIDQAYGRTHLPELTPAAKERLSRVVRWPLMTRLMRLGIWVFAARQQVGVHAVAFDPQGRVLVLRHVFHPARPWGLPGGWLGTRERPEEAVVRELREETGLHGTVGPPLWIERSLRPSHLTIAYLMEVTPGPLTLSSEILEARWCTPDDLPASMYEFNRQAIDAGLRLRRLLADDRQQLEKER